VRRMLGHLEPGRGALCTLAVLLAAFVSQAQASSATLLLEEPYGKLGFFTATGHAAVYLSGVCADGPLVLRVCNPGEPGIVLSRYDGIGTYDWVAMPLIPYLYAVERPEDVPLFADAKMASFLRDRYRRKYLESLAPDLPNGEAPGGNWYELVGSSYDRTIYGFTIGTTAAQDEALVRKYNSSANRSHFHLVSRNCADFAKDVINFYYPKSLHRSLIADVGMTTPKQMAKRIVRLGQRHPQLHSSRLVIAQVPGSMPRSTAVHGVVESFFKSKKYIVPSAIVSPIFAGCVAVVYVGSGIGRFDPAQNAMIYNAGSDPELPVGREDRRAYKKELEHLLAARSAGGSGVASQKNWERFLSKATVDVDDEGSPALQMQLGLHQVSVGVSAGNVLSSDAPRELVQQLLVSRLQAELRHSTPPGVSEAALARDWGLLQQALEGRDQQWAADTRQHSTDASISSRGTRSGGNRP
jgi:hypothetical protein